MAEKKDVGTAAYIFGVLSIVFAFFGGWPGVVLGIIGLVQSNKVKSEKSRKFSIIGIVLGIIMIILNAVLILSSLGENLGSLFPVA